MRTLLAGWMMFLACVSPAHADSASLLQAKLEKVEQGGLVGPEGDVNFGVMFRLTFRVLRVLSGSYPEKQIVTVITQHSKPIEGFGYFVLVTPKEGVVRYEPEDYGLCFNEAEARAHGISAQLLRRYPCK
jgi:hypothetical protein